MKKITLIIVLFCGGFISAQNYNYSIKNLEVNSEYQDYGATYFGNDKVVFASSRKTKSIRNRKWRGNNQPFLELYIGVLLENGEISDIESFSKKINSKFHDADITFTKDLKTIYFTRNNFLNKKVKKDTLNRNLNQLYKASFNDKGDWDVQQMPFNNDNYQTGHPALNKAEDKLYFISDMLGGFGKTDIYVVDILNDGTYGKPRNLGPNVNTLGKEMFPFIDKNNVLYFSSDGFKDAQGGLDIFVTKLDEKSESVVAPINLGYPINTDSDDFNLRFSKKERIGYLASNRPGGKGDDDIYSFIELNPIAFECNQIVYGTARDEKIGALLPGSLVALFNGEELIESTIVGPDAKFMFEVNCNETYRVVGTKDNYIEDFKVFETSNVRDLKLKLELNLDNTDFVAVRGQFHINIESIYFDLDKSFIRTEAEIELKKVVDVMQKYPKIKIDLGSHTDSRAADSYNLKLSERRAKSTKDWIVSKGIDPSRINAKGFGETQLVNECSNGVKCSKENHQLNRRTEFVIVDPETIK